MSLVNAANILSGAVSPEAVIAEATARKLPPVGGLPGILALMGRCKNLTDICALTVNLTEGAPGASKLAQEVCDAYQPGCSARSGAHYVSLLRSGWDDPADRRARPSFPLRYRPASGGGSRRTAAADLSGLDADTLRAMLPAVEGTPLAAAVRDALSRLG